MSTRRSIIVSTGLLLALVVGAGARAQVPTPTLSGRVVDDAGILSAETEQLLTHLLAVHEDSTGNQIAVLTTPDLDGEAIEAYALRVARAWELGTAEHDNGILLVVAPNDREVRIEVGYGLEGDLPDAVAARIIRHEIVPRFRENDFDGGVEAGVTAILDALAGSYVPEEDQADMPLLGRLLFALLFGAMPLFMAGQALLAEGCGRWFVFFFAMPFLFFAGYVAFLWMPAGLLLVIAYAVVFIYLNGRPATIALREKVAAARKKGGKVPIAIGGMTFNVNPSSFSSSGGSSGGFSGGGGSFGGGGASGSW